MYYNNCAYFQNNFGGVGGSKNIRDTTRTCHDRGGGVGVAGGFLQAIVTCSAIAAFWICLFLSFEHVPNTELRCRLVIVPTTYAVQSIYASCIWFTSLQDNYILYVNYNRHA
uniref:Uncharacterized protein n=1 Tax=Schizaphis graminum TaxID=13262 RepID=A0A2S2NIL5_SCHGA